MGQGGHQIRPPPFGLRHLLQRGVQVADLSDDDLPNGHRDEITTTTDPIWSPGAPPATSGTTYAAAATGDSHEEVHRGRYRPTATNNSTKNGTNPTGSAPVTTSTRR